MASDIGYGERWTSTASCSKFCCSDTEAAKTFLTRLLGEYDVPEVIHTDQLRSYGAAIREIPSLVNVDHQQVISTARCNNLIEQRASVASRAVRIPANAAPNGSSAASVHLAP